MSDPQATTLAPSTDLSPGSRHLVDPEIALLLDYFPPFGFTPQALPEIRTRLAAMSAGAPDPAVAFPTVSRQERLIPGWDGEPDVRVLVYSSDRDAAGPAGGLVWMHGGGLVLGRAEDDDLLCHRMVDATDATIVAVDYRLAPETPAPGALHDCHAALTWLRAEATTLGVDQNRIAVGGLSAGAGLAACLSILTRDRREPALCFQLLIYPMLDDRTGTTRPAPPFSGEFVWTAQDNAFGWRCYLGPAAGGPTTSPHNAAARVASTAGLPPTYLGVGSIDLFAPENIEFASRLIADGVPTELHVYPGGYHGFTATPAARISAAHVRDFFAALSRKLAA